MSGRPTKTSCPKGHPYSGENLIVRVVHTKNGKTYNARYCRECTQEKNRMNSRMFELARKDFLKDGGKILDLLPSQL